MSNAWLLDTVIGGLSFGLNLFVGITLAYDRPVDIKKALFFVVLTVLAFFTVILLNMLVILVARLNG